MLWLFLWTAVAEGFLYLPGVAPRSYQKQEDVELKVNKLDSIKTQLDYDFYSLPFCKPAKVIESSENLGEILSGDVIKNSAYELSMKLLESCKILCRQKFSKDQLKQFEDKIRDEYSVNMIIDNIPAATVYVVSNSDEKVDPENESNLLFQKGFALGFVGKVAGGPGIAYLNNHIRLIISYHEDQEHFDGYRIISFQVEPFSVMHELDGAFKEKETILKSCNALHPISGNAKPVAVSGKDAQEEIIFTYDVSWKPSHIKWASRWDLYFKILDSQIHWFSILNSMMVVLFLSGMVAMILMRTLHRDLELYNEELTEEQQAEESGWKLISGDVFRPPAWGATFSVLIGTGCQCFAMILLTLIFACLGFLSPANRGGLMTAFLLLFVFMGMMAGYFATRTFKMFKLTEWKRNTFHTAIFFPGVVFTVFFILNLFVWGEKSSGAIPFGTLIALLCLWFGISVPLCYIGSYFAFKKAAIDPPVRVNNLPRPEATVVQWYNKGWVAILAGGALPFAAVFIELFFVMSSVWQHQFYYVFPILTCVFFILIITCAQTSILLCYFQLCSEDYHWWWRSFMSSASSGYYLFGYSVFYFFTSLEITHFVSGLVFFSYMFLVSFGFWVTTGTVGHLACYYFVRKIYSSIKID